MLKSLIQTLLAVFSSFAILGAFFWFLLSIIWMYQDSSPERPPINWSAITLVLGVFLLGVFGLTYSVKKIKAERRRVRAKMKVLEKLESD